MECRDLPPAAVIPQQLTNLDGRSSDLVMAWGDGEMVGLGETQNCNTWAQCAVEGLQTR